jgi:hypothetical protein
MENVFFTPDIERSGLNSVKGTEKDVKEGVPIERGGDVSLSCAYLSLEAWSFGRVGKREASKALCAKCVARVRSSDKGISKGIKFDQIACDVGGYTSSYPGCRENRLGHTIEGSPNVP